LEAAGDAVGVLLALALAIGIIITLYYVASHCIPELVRNPFEALPRYIQGVGIDTLFYPAARTTWNTQDKAIPSSMLKGLTVRTAYSG
jgi:hypothetical protein